MCLVTTSKHGLKIIKVKKKYVPLLRVAMWPCGHVTLYHSLLKVRTDKKPQTCLRFYPWQLLGFTLAWSSPRAATVTHLTGRKTCLCYEIPCKDCPEVYMGELRGHWKSDCVSTDKQWDEETPEQHCTSCSEDKPLHQLEWRQNSKTSWRVQAEEDCGNHSDQVIHLEHKSRLSLDTRSLSIS